MMFSFSSAMPRIFGGVSIVGGGVGGTSPVIFTSASTPAQRSLSAVTGPMVKTSPMFGDEGGVFWSFREAARPVSRDGLGLGGG